MYDRDILNEFLENLSKISKKELDATEKELQESLNKINKYLHKVDENIKKAEEEGDELLYNLELNKKNIILQKLSELENLSLKTKNRS